MHRTRCGLLFNATALLLGAAAAPNFFPCPYCKFQPNSISNNLVRELNIYTSDLHNIYTSLISLNQLNIYTSQSAWKSDEKKYHKFWITLSILPKCNINQPCKFFLSVILIKNFFVPYFILFLFSVRHWYTQKMHVLFEYSGYSYHCCASTIILD